MDNYTEHTIANEKLWSKNSKVFDRKRYNYLRYLQKKVILNSNLKEEDSFLDIGCGTGWAVKYASKLCNNKGSFIGVDISKGMINKAKENMSGNIKFIQANAEAIPLKNNCFNIIICTNSFHHYFNPSKVLNEIKRLLKKNGKIYILDIASDGLLTNFIDKMYKKNEKEHVKYYSTKEFKRMFSEVGLKYINSYRFLFIFKLYIAEK